MHAAHSEQLILDAPGRTGFVRHHELEGALPASLATLRRDMAGLEDEGQIRRVRGLGKRSGDGSGEPRLPGTLFDQAITGNLAARKAICLDVAVGPQGATQADVISPESADMVPATGIRLIVAA